MSTNVAVGLDPTGVVVDPVTDLVYATNTQSNTVSVISGVTDHVTGTIAVGPFPQGLDVDPSTDTIYVANSDGTVSVIDGTNDSVTTSIPVGHTPLGVSVDPVSDTVYVTNSSDSSVSVINGSDNEVTTTIPVPQGAIGIATDSITDKVYIGGGDAISVIDGSNHSVTTTIPVGSSFSNSDPNQVAVDPTTDVIYGTNNNDGTLSVIDGFINTVPATIPLNTNPLSGVVVNPDTDTAFVISETGPVQVVSGSTDTVTSTVPVGILMFGASVDPSTGTVYTADSNGNEVSVINPVKLVTGLSTSSVGVDSSLLSLSVHFSAVLTSPPGQSGLAGQTITFLFGKTVECSAVTGTHGVATCSSSVLGVVAALLSGSSSAVFAGNAYYAASSATAKVSLL